MKTPTKSLLLLLAIPIAGSIGYTVWKHRPASSAPAQGRKIVCYQDSMHPWIKSDRPGKCTVCAMDLTPIYEGAQGFEASDELIVLSSNNITVLNVQTEPVQRLPLRRTVRVAGTLEASATSKRVIAAGKAGRIERLAVPYIGFEVAAGQPLADFFIPELLAEARRYVMLARSDTRRGESHAADLSNPLLSALQNLRLFGLTQAQIDNLAQTGKAEGSYEILSPLTGTVVERNVSEGQYVGEGAILFTIVDLSVLWFRFDAYEQDLPWLQLGQTVEFTVHTAPGRVFSGPITFIEPFLNETTRTAKVRVDVSNPPVEINGVRRRLLQHQLYAEGHVQAEAPACLVAPSAAILFPGEQAYAYVDKGGGVYEFRQVKLGRRGDQSWEICDGLDAGEQIVTSGNVLIDAQAQFNRSGSQQKHHATEPGTEPAMAVQSAAGQATSGLDASIPHSTLSRAQQEALQDFLAAADGVSRALAADSLEQLKESALTLPDRLAALVGALGADHAWQPLLQRIRTTAGWHAPADLAAARKSFLPFSTNLVELVQSIRTQEETFRSLKVYHCPMAPKPGLWFQAQGPLKNPFYGAKMLTCGEEVKRPATLLPGRSQTLAKPSPAAAPSPQPAHPTHAASTTSVTPASPPPVKATPPARPSADRPTSSAQIQPLNSRDHSFFDNRMNTALAARFASLARLGTNASGSSTSLAPLSATQPGKALPQAAPGQP